MKILFLIVSILFTQLAFAQQATYPRLVVYSMGKKIHPVTLASHLQHNSEFTAEVTQFKNVGTSQALRNEVIELVKAGAITPFEEPVLIMDTHAFWKTKYTLKKLDRFCMKEFNYCLKDVFEDGSLTNVNEIVSFIKTHKHELYKNVDKALVEKQRYNKAKMDALIGVFSLY